MTFKVRPEGSIVLFVQRIGKKKKRLSVVESFERRKGKFKELKEKKKSSWRAMSKEAGEL